MKKKELQKRFDPNRELKMGYLTMTGHEIVESKLEIRKYTMEVYGVFDKNTDKIWSGGFHSEKDATLTLEVIKSNEVQHYRRLMDMDALDDEAKAEKLQRFKAGLKGR